MNVSGLPLKHSTSILSNTCVSLSGHSDLVEECDEDLSRKEKEMTAWEANTEGVSQAWLVLRLWTVGA